MFKRLALCAVTLLSLSGFAPAEVIDEQAIAACAQAGYVPGDPAFEECRMNVYGQMAQADYEAYNEAQLASGGYVSGYTYEQPVFEMGYYDDGYERHHGRRHNEYYPRHLKKGEHFYNEHGQYCKLTHGKRIMCK